MNETQVESWRKQSLSVSARLGALSFHRSGKFRVLHISDIQDGAKPSKSTATLIATAVDAARPDIVIFTGNIIAGYSPEFSATFRRRPWLEASSTNEGDLEHTCELVTAAYSSVLTPLVERGIPFAMTFGNHDVQCGLDADELERLAMQFTGCLNGQVSAVLPEQPWLERFACGAGTLALPIRDTAGHLVFNLALAHVGDYAAQGGYVGPSDEVLQWLRELPQVLPNHVQTMLFQHLPLATFYQALQEVDASTAYAVEGYRTFEGRYFVLDDARTEPSSYLGEGISCADDMREDMVLTQGGYAGVFAGHDHRNGFVAQARVSAGALTAGADLVVGDGNSDKESLNEQRELLCAITPTCGFDTYGPALAKRAVRLIEFDIRHPFNPRTQLLEFGDIGQRAKSSQAYTFGIERVDTTPGRGWNLVYKSGLFRKKH